MKSLHFETPQHKALECETLIRSMHGKNQDGVCHATRNKHKGWLHAKFEAKGRPH